MTPIGHFGMILKVQSGLRDERRASEIDGLYRCEADSKWVKREAIVEAGHESRFPAVSDAVALDI